MRPVIGITTRTRSVTGSLGTLPTHTVPVGYTEAVLQAGGLPVLLPVLDPDDAVELASRCDGVLLAGGGDIDPARHGRAADDTVYDLDTARDAAEIAVACAAVAERQPLLGVCRGLQVLNVALGGDLVVDIPGEVGGAVVHQLPEPGAVPRHEVALAPDSRLAARLGTTALVVNSSHHQAVGRVGQGLRPVAWAPDGVVEAVEATDGAPLWGVQWHPELRPPDDSGARGPFALLVDAAGGRG